MSLENTEAHRLYHEGNKTKAVRLWMADANRGNADSQVNLGICYFRGDGGLVINNKEGIRLLTLSANQGYSPALYMLGILYRDGNAVKKNTDLAIELLTQSADQGYEDALNTLGAMYYLGEDAIMDKAEGIRLWTLSANKGNKDAIHNLEKTRLNEIEDIPAEDINIQDYVCKVCMSNASIIAFNCGHLVTCKGCSEKIYKCPACRVDISSRMIIYT